jgi:glyoxylase-like metal-dependent hydrolase (beta-lactamase superfamily II)
VHFCLHTERGAGILFCSDLLSRDADGALRFVPGEYHDDPAQTRRSVEGLLELEFAILCLDHGAPGVYEPRRAIAELLAA